MMSFCVDTVTVPEMLRAQHGVLRVASLQVTTDAVEAARKIIEEAHTEARNVQEQAYRDAETIVNNAELQVFERSRQLFQVLEKERDTFLERGKDVIIDLACTLFERLVMEMSQREKVAAALKRVMAEAPRRLINPVLRVHPSDVPCLPELEWDIKEDDTLSPGSCKLTAGNGEWYVDFDAAVTSLKATFASFTVDPPPSSDSEPKPELEPELESDMLSEQFSD